MFDSCQVLAPRLPRLKEWAYAGMLFDLTAASVAHAAVGDPLGNVVAPILLLGIVMASWRYAPGSASSPARRSRRAKEGPSFARRGPTRKAQ